MNFKMDPSVESGAIGPNDLSADVEVTTSFPVDEAMTATDDGSVEETGGPNNPNEASPTIFIADPNSNPESLKAPLPTTELTTSTATATFVPGVPGGSKGRVTTEIPLATAGESHRGGKDGLAPGAVAGIAIATAIIGAVIAFLAAFLLFKRRKRKERGNALQLGKYESAPSLARGLPSPYHPVPAMSSSNIPDAHFQDSHIASAPARAPSVIAPVPIRSSTATLGVPLAGIVPPPADRATIQAKVSDMFSRIHRHIETYYRDFHATITASMEGELAKFGMGDVSMAQLLESSSSPTVALKHALVAYVLGITNPDRDADETLFPRDILRDNFDITRQGHGELTTAYILHRRLSAHLYSSLTHPSRSLELQSTMREAAEQFSLTFFPWANPGFGDMEKDADLVQNIIQALDTIVWLYGQPYLRTEFIWEAHVTNRGTVISPGLVGVGPSEGARDVLLEPAVGPS